MPQEVFAPSDLSDTIVRAPTKTLGTRLLPDDDTPLSELALDGLSEDVDRPSVGHAGSGVASLLALQVNARPGVPAFVSSQHNGREESALESPLATYQLPQHRPQSQITTNHKVSIFSCVHLYASRNPR